MPSPIFRINGGSPGVKASVSASSSVTCTLDSTDGVRSVTWSVVGTDDTTTAGSYTLVQSGSVGQTVTFTSGAAGTALILRAEINGGVNLQTEQADPTTRATGKVYVVTTGGLEVACVNEQLESSATYGWTGVLNGAIRNAGGGGGSPEDVEATADTLALRGPDAEMKAAWVETPIVRTATNGDITLQHGSTAFARIRSTTAPEQARDIYIDASGKLWGWSDLWGTASPLTVEIEHPRHWSARFEGGASPMQYRTISFPSGLYPAFTVLSAIWVPESSLAPSELGYVDVTLAYKEAGSADPPTNIMTVSTAITGWTQNVGVSLSGMFANSELVPAGCYLMWAIDGGPSNPGAYTAGTLFVETVRTAAFAP